MSSDKKVNNKNEGEKNETVERIIAYLEMQKSLIIEELKAYETPISDSMSAKEIEAMMLRKQLYQLQGNIKVIRLLAYGKIQ